MEVRNKRQRETAQALRETSLPQEVDPSLFHSLDHSASCPPRNRGVCQHKTGCLPNGPNSLSEGRAPEMQTFGIAKGRRKLPRLYS